MKAEDIVSSDDRFRYNLDLASSGTVDIDLNRPTSEVLAELTKYPIRTRLNLTGTLIVARDIGMYFGGFKSSESGDSNVVSCAAHAKLQERIDNGEGLPDYIKNHPVYYAGPAKTPEGFASGTSAAFIFVRPLR